MASFFFLQGGHWREVQLYFQLNIADYHSKQIFPFFSLAESPSRDLQIIA